MTSSYSEGSVISTTGSVLTRLCSDPEWFRPGMTRDIYGQHVVLVCCAWQIAWLLLPAHGSLRIYASLLEHCGLSDPRWRLETDSPDMPDHPRTGDLLFWLWTFAVQVNMQMIIDMLAECDLLWQVMPHERYQLPDDIDFDDSVQHTIRYPIFHALCWPQKLLLISLTERTCGTGGMPSGKGGVVNLFLRLTNKRDQ